MSRKPIFLDLIWLVLWGSLASIWCWTAARQLGGTYDEPVYLVEGLQRWRTGHPNGLMRLGTMPLPVDVVTLPIYLVERFQGRLIDPISEWDRVLPLARSATLVFFWVLLLYSFLYARLLGGVWAGRLVVPWIACEPSLLAHSALATTDLSITACMLGLVYSFQRWREGQWLSRVGLSAFWFGLALSAKASALVYAPICLIVVGVTSLIQNDGLGFDRSVSWFKNLQSFWGRLQPLRSDVMSIFFLGLAFCFIYVGCDWEPQADFVKWAHTLPDGTLKSGMVWVSEHLCLFNNAGAGIARQITHNIKGHGSYLLGFYHPRALWFYFPVLLVMKLSLATLIPLVIVLLLRPRGLANPAFFAAIALFLLTPTFRVQLGIRMVLPLVALALVGLAVALVRSFQQSGPGGRKFQLLLVTGVIAWGCVDVITVWPHGISFVNQFWGGTRNGYRIVSEANYDWGQGLPELARWQERNQIREMEICYYGTDPLIQRMHVKPIPLFHMNFDTPDALAKTLAGKYLAINTSLMNYCVDTPGMRQTIAYLNRCQPMARTTTFLIYDFTQPGENAVSRSNGQEPPKETDIQQSKRIIPEPVRGVD